MKLYQIGDNVRATKTLTRPLSRVGIIAGRLYEVAQVRTIGDTVDLLLVGVPGWWDQSTFNLEATVPDNFKPGLYVRRMKASHGGVVQGATYVIEAVNRKLGLIRLLGVKGSFRASSFVLRDTATERAAAQSANQASARASAPPTDARTVGWKNEDGAITVNPNVAATWITSGAFSNVQRVYVQAA